MLPTLDATLAAVGREIRHFDLAGPRSREAWKAVCCVLLGLALSFALLEVREVYWVAISAFMVTRASAAETARRALLRLLGTIGGAGAGLLLVPVTAGQPVLLIVAMGAIGFVSLFQAEVSRTSYAWVFFGLTALLVLTTGLSESQSVVSFAAVRIAEIGLGAIAGSVVTWLFERIWPAPEPDPPASIPGAPLFKGLFDETWLADRWPLLHQAARSALALALLPLIWRLLSLQDLAGTAVTSFIVMVVPATTILGHTINQSADHAVRHRAMHRAVGCLLGGGFGLFCLALAGGGLLAWLLLLSAGIWIGARIQNGSEGVGYCGTQFAIAFLITLVQDNGPATSILPALDRLEGILIGVALLGLLLVIWPLPSRPDGRPHLDHATRIAGQPPSCPAP